MKAPLLSLLTACVLFLSGAAAAQDHRDNAGNYGYDKNHKVTPQERARWEQQHKSDHR